MKLKELIYVKNEYSGTKKYKVINLFGIKIKFKVGKISLSKAISAVVPKKQPSSVSVSYSTVHYLIAMLRAYGIKNIVSSPGTQNAGFNLFLQEDKFFNIYSVVDERSAVYVASGIAYETGEPVVVTCTEATASRNWLSGLTEAYYRNLPIIACSFYNEGLNKFAFSQQYSDRSVTQNDVKRMFVELPVIHNFIDKRKALIYMNAALSSAKYKSVPVHINCPSLLNISHIDTIKSLPQDIWTTKVYKKDFSNLAGELQGKNTAVFIGAHHKFTKECENALSDFAKSAGIPVICDHTSNYHGANKVLISHIDKILVDEFAPEIIVDIGDISGEYNSVPLFAHAKTWRISEDFEYHARYSRPCEKLFACDETYFFKSLTNTVSNSKYYEKILSKIKKYNSCDLPFSLPYIARGLSSNIPVNSSLHLAILNSLRSMNYFDLHESIDAICNVGGFGIDGACSTLIGQSLANKNKKCFGLVGDLAFFYDMNILGNRHVGDNVRLLLVNNNKGVEFYVGYIGQIDNKENRLDDLVAAGGHYSGGAKAWAQSCGFEYLSASSASEFDGQIKDFCNKDFKKPVLFECFTDSLDEDNAIRILKDAK